MVFQFGQQKVLATKQFSIFSLFYFWMVCPTTHSYPTPAFQFNFKGICHIKASERRKIWYHTCFSPIFFLKGITSNLHVLLKKTLRQFFKKFRSMSCKETFKCLITLEKDKEMKRSHCLGSYPGSANDWLHIICNHSESIFLIYKWE